MKCDYPDCRAACGKATGYCHKGSLPPAAEEAQAWRPIETAPKDRFILLAAEFDGPGDWRIKMGEYRTKGDVGWHILGASWTPTRWLPLPPKPGATSEPKPLDDPRLQQQFGDAIEGALAFGYQDTNKPPEGHWLWRFWNLGRAQAAEPVRQPSLTSCLQQKCTKWGAYWRAPDAHGVDLSMPQAADLLRDALGVEVEVKCLHCLSTTTEGEQQTAPVRQERQESAAPEGWIGE